MAEEPPRKKIVLDLNWFPEPELTIGGRVHLLPADQWVRLEAGESVFEGARRRGIAIPTECGGKGTCGRCRVLCAPPAPTPGAVERQLLGGEELARGIRLACRTRPTSDLTVTVLPEWRGEDRYRLSHCLPRTGLLRRIALIGAKREVEVYRIGESLPYLFHACAMKPDHVFNVRHYAK